MTVKIIPPALTEVLDDHLFGAPRFAAALLDGMRGMGRLWQAAGTVNAILAPGLLERAVAAGLRSLFVGFETLNPPTSTSSASTRTCGATTAPRFTGCTTSV